MKLIQCKITGFNIQTGGGKPVGCLQTWHMTRTRDLRFASPALLQLGHASQSSYIPHGHAIFPSVIKISRLLLTQSFIFLWKSSKSKQISSPITQSKSSWFERKGKETKLRHLQQWVEDVLAGKVELKEPVNSTETKQDGKNEEQTKKEEL